MGGPTHQRGQISKVHLHIVQKADTEHVLLGMQTWRCCHDCLYSILQRGLSEVFSQSFYVCDDQLQLV